MLEELLSKDQDPIEKHDMNSQIIGNFRFYLMGDVELAKHGKGLQTVIGVDVVGQCCQEDRESGVKEQNMV